MDNDLAASVLIRNINNVWIDDNMVTACYCCKAEFGYLFNRKHHCRNCGNIFCHKCADKCIEIPAFITERPGPADIWNISYYISSLKTPEERVCKQCYEFIKNKQRAYQKIIKIFDNPVSIDKIRELPDSDTDVKNHYFDHLRNIQYYLPNHKYTDIDKKLLKANAMYFGKHSKYLMHLIKSIDWGSVTNNIAMSNRPSACNNQLDFIISIIISDKNKSCNELYCTRTCSEILSCDDCINILYSCAETLPDKLTEFMFDIIEKTPEQVILCHLPFFISLIVKNSSSQLLQRLLLKLLTQSTKMIYHCFWFLTNAKEKANHRETTNINRFINLFDKNLKKQMYGEYLFFAGLIDNLANPADYLSSTFEKIKPVSLPYNPDKKIVSVDLSSISIKNSYTKPVVIPFQLDTGEVINLLFKKESIINDVTVLNLMTLCDIILCDNLNTNFGVIVYPTMPLTANSGMIEIVENAETIYAITSKKKPILQHIIERNEERKIGDVLDRYTLSLVSYTLHSYFLALGDRHLQNIMITDDAAIFHIDFGYILGSDAYPLTSSDIKLNGNMLDVLGGYDGYRYKQYLELCATGIILLRKYFNMFFILLAQDTNFKLGHIDKFVMTRFQPRQTDAVVITELMSVIKQSNNAFSGYIRDFLHYHTQEKTVQNGIAGVLGSAYDIVKNFAISRSN